MRQRMTWKNSGVRQRRASEHPAYPDEGPASPAYQPEPGADAYDIGGPSEFAEDPHPGPYVNSQHPAYPDEGPASPAYKAAKLEREAALERKAAKCIRIASAMLGNGASVKAVEDQALDLMDLSDRQIRASLSRLAEEDVEEEVEEESKKKASRRRSAKARRSAGYHMDDESMLDEMMLEEMLAEEGMGHAEEGMMSKHSEEDVMLAEMLAEEGMGHAEEGMGHAEEGMGHAEEGMMSPDSEMMHSEMMADPMGMTEMVAEGDEMMMLAKLFNASEDESEKKPAADVSEKKPAADGSEDESEDESKKKASARRPQPKRAAKGATSLGGGAVSKIAASEVNDLSKLWESAPDVSRFF